AEKDFKKVLNAALRLIRFRPRSENEIISRLEDKGYGTTVIKKAVKYLKGADYLNDAEFCRIWIGSRRDKPLGFKKIIQELKEKGVKRDIIEHAVKESQCDYNEGEVIERLVSKRFGQARGPDKGDIKRRAYSFLLRRGFSPDAVNEAVSKIE
ncbi:MAG: regulatory protein RecX, partial [Syntrophales bacterium]|nr:regulatory protein RecX [Syntrophales bacterium]